MAGMVWPEYRGAALSMAIARACLNGRLGDLGYRANWGGIDYVCLSCAPNRRETCGVFFGAKTT